jgi:hypothetical protein
LTRAFEIFYATTRLARVDAPDAERAKRSFAAYVLYDDATNVESDVEYAFGDDAAVSPAFDPPPAGGSRIEVREWLARVDANAEPFEVGLYEDPARALDPYLRLLATNDPWRLEGHGSLGRTLSAVPVFGNLVTFDGRVRHRFDATQFFDYVRRDVVDTLDPEHPQDSVRVESLVDVSALRDDVLRQIASSYETIVREHRLTSRFTETPSPDRAFEVSFDRDGWATYLAHRLEEPARFLPPAAWSSAFPRFDDIDET